MAYMAISLAFLAGMILLNYFLFNVHPVQGRTLNAVLFEQHAAAVDTWRALTSAR